MMDRVSKALLRRVVPELCNGYIYSTANLKSTGEYRMSLPWDGRFSGTKFSAVPPGTWLDCHRRRDQLIQRLVERFPQLQGHVRGTYHIGSGLYLSLRVNNHV
ncbi:MAG: hypothetical protein ACK5XN_33825, partial [Bacteroidota bacterium]